MEALSSGTEPSPARQVVLCVERLSKRFGALAALVEAWQDNRARLFAQATGHFLMPGGDG